MTAEWAAVSVALLLGVINLIVTLWLNRRRQRERAADKAEFEQQRKARQAMIAFDQDVVKLRQRFVDLEALSARIVEIAGNTDAATRRAAVVRIFESDMQRVLQSLELPLELARLWSRDEEDAYVRRLRDVEVLMAATLRELANESLTSTHQISRESRRIAQAVHAFSADCRLWLYDISEALSSGKLQPPQRQPGDPEGRHLR